MFYNEINSSKNFPDYSIHIETHSSVSTAKKASWHTSVFLPEPSLASFQPIVV